MTSTEDAVARIEADIAREWKDSGGPDDGNPYHTFTTRVSDVQTLIAALTKQQHGDDGWQPIETAPDDRPALVTFNPDDIAPGYKTSPGIMVAYWDAYYASGGNGYTGHSGWVDAYSGEECYLHHGDPTHWRPLPEPPALAALQLKGE